MEECECRGLPVARAVLVVFSCFLLLYGAEAQQRGESAEPNVFNTSSCIEPPYRCPHRRIQFYLYTRATQEDPQLLNTLDASSLHQSRFDPQHQTKIIIHGFGGGRHLSPSTDLRDGLDPTILFYMGNNRSRDLDPTDAHFIDVIHTGAGILGQWGPNGHADFYVNGGTSQPGCAQNSIYRTLSCDHTKVTPYFIESINSKPGFWAVPCPNQFLYYLGFCNPPDEQYVLMGEHVTHKARGIYYLTTNAKKPYAKGFPGGRRPPRRANS